MDLIKLCLKDFPGLYIDRPEWITSTENGKMGKNREWLIRLLIGLKLFERSTC